MADTKARDTVLLERFGLIAEEDFAAFLGICVNHAVGHYGTLMRQSTPESQWDALRPTLPRYKRVTEVWPARAAFEARKAREAAAKESAAAASSPAYGLRLVVDNGRPVEAVTPSPTLGGAA